MSFAGTYNELRTQEYLKRKIYLNTICHSKGFKIHAIFTRKVFLIFSDFAKITIIFTKHLSQSIKLSKKTCDS